MLTRVGALAHVNLQASQRALVLSVVDNGIAWAVMELGRLPVAVQTTDATVAKAASYVSTMIPGTLKALGVTEPQLAQIVTAKIPQS